MSKWNFIGSTTSPSVTTIAGFNRPASATWSPFDSMIYIVQSRGFNDWDIIKLNPTTDALSAAIPIASNTYNDPGFANYYGQPFLGANNKLYLPEHGSGTFVGLELKVFDIPSQTFDAAITSTPYNTGAGAGNACAGAVANQFFVAMLNGRVARFSPAFVDLGSLGAYSTGVLGGTRYTPVMSYNVAEDRIYVIGPSAAVYGSPSSNPSTWTAIAGWSDSSTFGPMGAVYISSTQEILFFSSAKSYVFKNGTFTEKLTFSPTLTNCGTNPVLAPNGRVYFGVIDTGATSRIYSYDPIGHVIVGQSSNSVNLNVDGKGCHCPLTNNAYFANWSASNPSVVRRIPCVF